MSAASSPSSAVTTPTRVTHPITVVVALGEGFGWCEPASSFVFDKPTIVSREPIPRRDLFSHRYGVKASLVYVSFRRNHQCTPELARMLLRGGALAPRYFILYVINLIRDQPVPTRGRIDDCADGSKRSW
ncbi:hypothetical protein BJ742DRAFT_772490 [Cladochytrium replicatum]|nr:hypothetical protein BJ742DRAFT_772490 [Cladochytrium replicatum]